MPVKLVDGEYQTLLGLPPEEGGYANDPVLGLVENLGVSGTLLSFLEVYVGILAATILFIATNAGVIGASRITYAMAGYRQLPEVFRRLHPRFKTPWLSLVVFAGDRLDRRLLIPGQTDFLGTMYSFGAMLSFTIAHVSIIALRYRRRDAELVFKGRPNLRMRGVDWPLFAFFGGLGTGLAWLVVVVQTPDTRIAGLGWLVLGFVVYFVYRRRVRAGPAARDCAGAGARPRPLARAPVPAQSSSPSSARPSRRRRSSPPPGSRPIGRATIAIVTVLEVPLSLPLDAELARTRSSRRTSSWTRPVPLSSRTACVSVTRLLRARRAGPAIVEEAAAPRGRADRHRRQAASSPAAESRSSAARSTTS